MSVDRTADPELWMRRALAEAARGIGAVEPNPMVGAVVVRDGQVVGVGHHARFGGPHAEVVALEAAGESANGATVFVTLEPCCHHGKTPPCTDALIRAGVARVVAAMADPFAKVAGGGFARLDEAGIAVEVGLLAEEARRLNAPYLKRLATGRPFVTAKWAMTLDGKIAARSGRSAWISGERSRALVHEVRGRMDAIVVGVGTAVADDPQLTARPPGPRVATRVVLDASARLPLGSKLATTATEIPVIVAATLAAPPERVHDLRGFGVRVLELPEAVPGRVDVGALLDELGRRGMTNVLVEGGGRVLGSFFDAGEVDEVDVFIAPIIEGGSHDFMPARGIGVDAMNEALRLDSPSVSRVDEDVRIRGRIKRQA
ncbi:MAG TPA: bifunctional diaminohydroxyphosphoribosylaminopyrimidine deaminase/5-amino-6-(5-phosphoribosylamino)uracil reductase RibD [Isosphaeraceae bacterium]